MYEFDELTRDALNEFRGIHGLAPQNYLDAQTAALLNQQLDQFAGQQVVQDSQMEKALELAREYCKQPLQYSVDEFGNFTNLETQQPETEQPAQDEAEPQPAA